LPTHAAGRSEDDGDQAGCAEGQQDSHGRRVSRVGPQGSTWAQVASWRR